MRLLRTGGFGFFTRNMDVQARNLEQNALSWVSLCSPTHKIRAESQAFKDASDMARMNLDLDPGICNVLRSLLIVGRPACVLIASYSELFGQGLLTLPKSNPKPSEKPEDSWLKHAETLSVLQSMLDRTGQNCRAKGEKF